LGQSHKHSGTQAVIAQINGRENGQNQLEFEGIKGHKK